MIHSHTSVHYQTELELYTTELPDKFELLCQPINITHTQNRIRYNYFSPNFTVYHHMPSIIAIQFY
jgi:hypothetical protein